MSTSRFQDFLDFAISNEIDAATLYEKYAAAIVSAPGKKLLTEMAAMERGHEKRLKNFKEKGVAYFSKMGVINDLHISDFMVDVTITPSSSLQEVFVFSMKAEEKAFELYSKLAEFELDDQSKALFKALASEEKKHKHDLESQYEVEFTKEN
jgi:rubrerythrin